MTKISKKAVYIIMIIGIIAIFCSAIDLSKFFTGRDITESGMITIYRAAGHPWGEFLMLALGLLLLTFSLVGGWPVLFPKKI
ncbi:hypothetical protein JW968_03660 [Candidatus Woesearchaeota archaeon]|nr:hypothetical protein [Candidatus Woesearchaeota archaeon]